VSPVKVTEQAAGHAMMYFKAAGGHVRPPSAAPLR
jgi:hypothetical protein